MEPWPFTHTSPEDFVGLTDREAALLECIVAAFLAFTLAQGDDTTQPPGPLH